MNRALIALAVAAAVVGLACLLALLAPPRAPRARVVCRAAPRYVNLAARLHRALGAV